MKLIVIDIETTSLEPDRGQIVEFAFVLDDWSQPKPCYAYSRLIRNDPVYGDLHAVAMHGERWKAIAEVGQPLDAVMESFKAVAGNLGFLKPSRHDDGFHKFIAAGKNYGSFDGRWLERPLARVGLRAVHRSLDPVSLYAEPGDADPPPLEECCRRAGLSFDDRHHALADALMVCRLLRAAKGLPYLFNDPEAL